MYYFHLLSSPSMQLSDSGKQRTNHPQREFGFGRDYRIYLRLLKEFENMGNDEIPVPFNHIQLKNQTTKLGRSLLLQPGEIEASEKVLDRQTSETLDSAADLHEANLENACSEYQEEYSNPYSSPIYSVPNFQDLSSQNLPKSDIQTINFLDSNEEPQDTTFIKSISLAPSSKNTDAKHETTNNINLDLVLGTSLHSDTIPHMLYVPKESVVDNTSLAIETHMHQKQFHHRSGAFSMEGAHKRKSMASFNQNNSPESLKSIRIEPGSQQL